MMSRRQIEESREVRLWFTQVIVPLFGVTMLVPEWRETVVTKVKDVAGKIKSKIQK